MAATFKRGLAWVLCPLFLVLILDLMLKVTLLGDLNYASSDAEHAQMQRWASFYLSTFGIIIISFVPLHVTHAWLSLLVDNSISRLLNVLLLAPSIFVLSIWFNVLSLKVWLFG